MGIRQKLRQAIWSPGEIWSYQTLFLLHSIPRFLIKYILSFLFHNILKARAAGLTLTCSLEDLKDSFKKVELDKFKVEQVLRNFIVNAMKFSKTGGEINVKVKFQMKNIEQENQTHAQSQEFFHVEVKDSGVGISKVKFALETLYLYRYGSLKAS